MEPHSCYLKEQSDGDRDTDDEPLIFGKMLRHFMAPGNDKFRQKRLKFIPRVVEVTLTTQTEQSEQERASKRSSETEAV